MSASVIAQPFRENVELDDFAIERLPSGIANTQDPIVADEVSVQNDSLRIDSIISADEEARIQQVSVLPPVDGGRRAW